MVNIVELKEVKKNQLEIALGECHTNVNEHDQWVGPITYIVSDVNSEDYVKTFMRCLEIAMSKIAESRVGYGMVYNSVDFEEFEEEFDEIEINDNEECIVFKKGEDTYYIPFEFDLGMPTEDGRYFAGIRFFSAVYYDNEGKAFNVTY